MGMDKALEVLEKATGKTVSIGLKRFADVLDFELEYEYFARAIDKRIETECIGCPPDVHPEEWFCAWRFRFEN